MGQKVAFIFPGQGSQSLGMGKALAEAYPDVLEKYQYFDNLLGIPLSEYCFNGPESELLKTEITQPAIVLTSALLAQKLMQKGIVPDFTAGHSVGEYSALVTSSALSLADAIKLVNLRGSLMDKACPLGIGGMAALIGLDEPKTQELISSLNLKDLVLNIAGLNCPGQVVIAGHLEAIDLAISKVKDFGGRMGMKLQVSGPFHSDLMLDAENGLKEALNKVTMQDASIPIFPNVEPRAITKSSEIKNNLMKQLTKPVLWEKTIYQMKAAGVTKFYELGAGNVLRGMLKKIDKSLEIIPISKPDDIG